MISANNVTLRIGKKALFEDVNIKFTEGNCYGLIGANGAGKSTFLKILSGQLDTTNGNIVITPGQRLSVLEQDHFKYDAFTVMDTVIMGNQRLYDIMKEKDAIYAKEDFSEEDGIRASELEGEFAEMNGWEAESARLLPESRLLPEMPVRFRQCKHFCHRHLPVFPVLQKLRSYRCCNKYLCCSFHIFHARYCGNFFSRLLFFCLSLSVYAHFLLFSYSEASLLQLRLLLPSYILTLFSY